jgi:hypothetical protein
MEPRTNPQATSETQSCRPRSRAPRIRRPLGMSGHRRLMPGNEDEAAALVDTYLERATGAGSGANAAAVVQQSQDR